MEDKKVYAVEWGYLLDKDSEDYEEYSSVYGGNNAYYDENQYSSYENYPSYNDNISHNQDDDEIEVSPIDDDVYNNFQVMGVTVQKNGKNYQGKIKIYFPNMQQTIMDNFKYICEDMMCYCTFGISYPQEIENQLSEYVGNYLFNKK